MVKDITKKSTLLFLALLINAGYATCAFAVDEDKQRPLKDGFLLRGIDGELITQDSNDNWFFKPDKDIEDGRGRTPAKTSLQILPSARLQMMIANANERADKGFRLWGRITKYKACNFIFPTYFLPLTKSQKTQPEKSVDNTLIDPSEKSRHNENEEVIKPVDGLDIPKEVLDKLGEKTYLKRDQINNDTRDTRNETRDFIFIDRVGFISKSGRWFIFIHNAFGRGVSETSFRLLPCQVLELAEKRQSAQPDPVRFKVAGIATEYKGEKYMLLQKAIRAYSHGNFGR